jgi:phthiodiolone/phenolphthiodiolone dimycocerosates ketoreductase
VVKFGVVLPTFYPAEANGMVLDACEAVGADSIWTLDHMMGAFPVEIYPEIPMSEFVPDPDAFFDPFCLCAWAGRTTDIPLGISVTDTTRRAAPDVARAALSLHNLCKGGFNLGLGSGEVENLTPFGYSFDRPVTRTEQFLKTLRHILETGRMPDGSGRFGYPVVNAKGVPKVWIASQRPRMLKLTGQYGDGWLPLQVETPDEYRHMKTVIAEHAAAASRPEPESGLWIFSVLGESREQVRQLFDAQPMAKLFALFSASEADWRKHGFPGHPAGKDVRGYLDYIPYRLEAAELRELAPRIPFELFEEQVYVGNASEVAERLGGMAAAGCEHLVVCNISGLAGGLTEAMARGPELAALSQAVRSMAPQTAAP